MSTATHHDWAHTSPLPGVQSDGDRPEGVAEICQLLEREIWAQDAAVALSRVRDMRSSGRRIRVRVHVLPVWQWVNTNGVGGRKAFRDGNALRGSRLLPVRTTWESGSVVVAIGDEPVAMRWSAAGMNQRGHGFIDVRSADAESPASSHTWVVADGDHRADLGSRSAAMAVLGRLVEDGKQARWAMLSILEKVTARALVKSNASVSLEVTRDRKSDLLDAEELNEIATRMVYGSDEVRTSMAMRLIARCTLPNAFLNVDPSRKIRMAVKSASESAVRSKIGDPHVGRKIRAVFDSRESWSSLEELVQAYRRIHPQDGVQRDRVASALLAGEGRLLQRVSVRDAHMLARDDGYTADLTYSDADHYDGDNGDRLDRGPLATSCEPVILENIEVSHK